jgi:hypothetical protein
VPLELPASAPTMLIRRAAFERAGLARSDFDARYNLTSDEFRVEGDMIAVGPLYDPDAITDLTDQLESLGLVYFDDFVEMSGNWPGWCQVFVRGG